MSNFKAEEVKSKTLDRFMSADEQPPTSEPQEGGEVVKLPQIEEPEEPEQEPEENDPEDDVHEWPEEKAPFEEEKCIPMIGRINKKAPAPSGGGPVNGSDMFKGRGTYVLYGLMGLGLASQLLK